MRVRLRGFAVVVVLAGVLPAVGQTPPSDTIQIIKENQQPSNVEIAVTLAESTPFDQGGRVIISRDDQFADALASGVLQDGAPLLLVPTAGPVPDGVAEQVASLSSNEAIILGGEAAVSADVEASLAQMGMTTSRRAGASRFETAIAIAAADAPVADTVLLARAFASPGATDPSQGFADSISAGGLAAENGWPILLTQTDLLSGPTRDYMTGATDLGQTPPRRVLILGGTAAISQAVEDELRSLGFAVERIAGASRAETAVLIAQEAGSNSAADVSRVVLVDGTGENAWAGGFASASHAAAFDAPILLAASTTLPPETEAFLESGIGGDPAAAPVLTCVVLPDLCETARATAGLPPVGSTPLPPALSAEQYSFALGSGEDVVFNPPVAEGYWMTVYVRGSNPSNSGCTTPRIAAGGIDGRGKNGPAQEGSPLIGPFRTGSSSPIRLSCGTGGGVGEYTGELLVTTQTPNDVQSLLLNESAQVELSDPSDFAVFEVNLPESDNLTAFYEGKINTTVRAALRISLPFGQDILSFSGNDVDATSPVFSTPGAAAYEVFVSTLGLQTPQSFSIGVAS